MALKFKELAKQIAGRETGKQVDITQISEILRIILDLFGEAKASEVLALIEKTRGD